MKKLISAFMLVCLLAGCNTDHIDLFGEERYIYFKSINGKHEFRYSFLYSEGKDVVELSFPLTYSGKLYNEAKTYSVEVVKDSTTALEGEEFLPLENMTFKASSYQDEFKLKIKNSARLKESEERLTLKLVSNENFVAAVRDSLMMDIYLTDKISKPSWWNQEVVDAYLGEYKEEKFELFVKNIYAGDYGKLTESEKLDYARKFKYWLQENPHYIDGEEIRVPVIG